MLAATALLVLLTMARGDGNSLAPSCRTRANTDVGRALEVGLLLSKGLDADHMREPGNGFVAVTGADHRGAPLTLGGSTMNGRVEGEAGVALEAYVRHRLEACLNELRQTTDAPPTAPIGTTDQEEEEPTSPPSPPQSLPSEQISSKQHPKTTTPAPLPLGPLVLAGAVGAASVACVLGICICAFCYWMKRGRKTGERRMTDIELD